MTACDRTCGRDTAGPGCRGGAAGFWLSWSGKNMYAVVRIKGQQFRVEPGRKLQVPLLDDEVGANVTFDDVLLLTDGEEIKVGSPRIEGASVAAEVLRHGRSRKITVFKRKRRKNYKRKKGHRQPFTEVSITGINA
jgi:large subunit ribosomal protein L21